jgi:hypothetical protein
MFTKFKVTAILMIFVLLTMTACATYHYEGAGAGAVVGGIAGALLDRKNPWRGGVVGAALGAVAGATITDISVRGSKEAATTGKTVEYKTEDGRGVYRAEPTSDYYRPDEHTKCRKVRERIWENDKLVKDTIKEVCESEKYEKRY